MKRLLLFGIILLLTSPLVAARSGHIAALAVTESNATNGTVAELYLEIRSGTGAIYIESFPLTNLDTQLSTRFANEIACQKWGEDCTQFDFFYVIDTKSTVIGGPSAGGALTVLTYAVLEDLPIDNETAMTGTIMSGGIIGPVGGVRGKVAGAAANGFSRVLIPAYETNESGIPLADRYGINVVRVETLDQAIVYFTGKDLQGDGDVNPPSAYTEKMRSVADELCLHADVLADQFNNTLFTGINESERAQITNQSTEAQDVRKRSHDAYNRSSYYSAASQCFAAATIYHRLVLSNADNETISNEEAKVNEQYKLLTEALETTAIRTDADLEVAMIINERLADAKRVLSDVNNETSRAQAVAYASERLETARAWAGLLGAIPSKEIDISPEQLSLSCSRKIAEAQERINYVAFVYPLGVDAMEASLREAFDDAQRHDYTLCLLHASQAKAEASALITAVHVQDSEFEVVVEKKLQAAREALSQREEQEAFPILGYSYAEYAGELLTQDKYSASLYVEYSLEFSQLDIYFPPKHRNIILDPELLMLFATGIVIGLVTGLLIGLRISKNTQKSHRPKKVPIARNLPGKKR